MKEKQIQLIELLSKEKVPLTSTVISNALEISVRSVKNYVKEINEFYEENIIKSSRKGYELVKSISIDLLYKNTNKTIPQNISERSTYIFRQLISSNFSKIDIYEFCEDLFISKSTLINTIYFMNNQWILEKIRFSINNDELSIEGDEKHIRKAIIKFIYHTSKGNIINNYLLENYFESIDVPFIIKASEEILNIKDSINNDFATFTFYLHLLIIIDRVRKGNHIENSNRDDRLNENIEIEDYIKTIEKEINISFNIVEKNEIYYLIYTYVDQYSSQFEEIKDDNGDNQMKLLVKHYVNIVNNHYLINLSSKQFNKFFEYHLRSLLKRSKNNSFINNPMSEIIKSNNPIIYDIAVFISIDFMERFNVKLSDDEISFIAIHIGTEIQRQKEFNSDNLINIALLIPTYLKSIEQLVNNIEEEFSNQIYIHQIINNIYDIDESFVDLLISTVPVDKENIKVPSIQISPIISQRDYRKIENIINTLNIKRKKERLIRLFDNFLLPNLFINSTDERNYIEVIHELGSKMVKKGFVNEDYIENVLKRESAASTAFGSIAIPHSNTLDANKTCIGIYISKKGISWKKNTVNLVFLIAININEIQIFRELYENLINIFDSQILLNEIFDTNNLEEFKEIVLNYLAKLEI